MRVPFNILQFILNFSMGEKLGIALKRKTMDELKWRMTNKDQSCHESYANLSFCHASDSVTNANMIIASVACSLDCTWEIYFALWPKKNIND